jgi:hypothetical protein
MFKYDPVLSRKVRILYFGIRLLGYLTLSAIFFYSETESRGLEEQAQVTLFSMITIKIVLSIIERCFINIDLLDEKKKRIEYLFDKFDLLLMKLSMTKPKIFFQDYYMIILKLDHILSKIKKDDIKLSLKSNNIS